MTGDVIEKSDGTLFTPKGGRWMDGGGRLFVNRAGKDGIMRRYFAPAEPRANVVKSIDGKTVYVRGAAGQLERADEKPRGKAGRRAQKKARRIAREGAAK